MPSYIWTTFETAAGEQHRYRDAGSGRYISARQVRAELDRFVDTAGRNAARDLTEIAMVQGQKRGLVISALRIPPAGAQGAL